MASVRATTHLNTMRLINLPRGYIPTSTLTKKTWYGLKSFYGRYIWTDGVNIYYSYGSNQYVLNGDTWETKTWYGLTSFNGDLIWSHNGVIYYSNGSNGQYYLSGDTWVSQTWGGFAEPMGWRVWTDGANVYHSYNAKKQYVLNGSTWDDMEWTGNADFSGEGIHTDGTNIYNGNGDMLSGTAWVSAGVAYRYGRHIWTDGVEIYYTYNYTTTVLSGAGGTKTWNGASMDSGDLVWTDGVNIYYSNSTSQYVLDATIEEPEPEITGISISPTVVSVARGETCQFTATVEGDEGCSQEVAFALSGNNGTSETTISETGLLEVGADETSETFSVIVYAVDNPEITATATVTVVVPDLMPVYKMEGGDWVKKTAYQMTSGEWVLISTASK